VAPTPERAAAPTPVAPASTADASPDALPTRAAVPPVNPAPAAAATRNDPNASATLAALAAAHVVGTKANVLLLIHSAPLRGQALGRALGKRLGDDRLLHAFFERGGLELLRDFDHVLLASSGERGASSPAAVLQYNVPRYKIRGATPELDELEFALAARQILLVAPRGAASAARVPRDFRLPEPNGEEALDLYVKAPAVVSLPAFGLLPKSLSWLRLSLAPDGSGSLSFAGADGVTDAVTGQAQLTKSELSSALEALLRDVLQRPDADKPATTD